MIGGNFKRNLATVCYRQFEVSSHLWVTLVHHNRHFQQLTRFTGASVTGQKAVMDQ